MTFQSSKPKAGAKINWANPITKGLMFFSLCSPGQSELVRGKNPTGTQPTYVLTPFGEAGKFDGTTQYMDYGGAVSYNTAGSSITAMGFGNPPSSGATSYCFFSKRTGSNPFPTVALYASYDAVSGASATSKFTLVITQTANTIFRRYGGSGVDGTYHLFGVSYNATADTGQAYLDGASITTTSATAGAVPSVSNSDALQIGRLIDPLFLYSGNMLWCAQWNRVLNADEHRSMYNNPWQVLAQPTRRQLGFNFPNITGISTIRGIQTIQF